jgi:CRISPR-associated protein Cmr4
MTSKILHIFTRTPLHVGAGASVGAIDQPVQRERHTGFPIIPASSLKGSFADYWNDGLETIGEGEKAKKMRGKSAAAWLFGSDDAHVSFAGSLLFSEARVLAFPIRSAKGSYAWITCPLMLQRAARDEVFGPEKIKDANDADQMNTIRKAALDFKEPPDGDAVFQRLDANDKDKGKLDLGGQIVLEEYCFKASSQTYPAELAEEISKLVDDALFTSIADRLVILSNGMMSHFVSTTCEIAQHVRISDETGTAEEGGLFNQENVPSETLFYSVLTATKSRVPVGELKDKSASEALSAFETKLTDAQHTFQFGGDASTGLGFCTVTLNNTKGA